MMGLLWIASSLLQLTGFVTLTLITGVIYKVKFAKKKDPGLQKPDWKKDVVYLCQFYLVPSVRTISPFALKLETWLRISGIKYENVFSRSKFHPKTGLIPYIELNGEQFSDSNLIIEMLQKKFEVEMDTELSAEEEAMTRAATGMVESFTAQTGFYYRYGLHMEDFVKTLRIGEYYGSEKTVRMWARVQPYITRLRSYVSGVSRQEEQVIWGMANKDLAALSLWLGDKQFFHGARPSSLDCTVFGHLAQFLFIDIGFPQKAYLENHCQNLVTFESRMKEAYWKDWDESIEKSRESLPAPE